eukprot:3682055-Pleurochrysis_carterae.AAC.3
MQNVQARFSRPRACLQVCDPVRIGNECRCAPRMRAVVHAGVPLNLREGVRVAMLTGVSTSVRMDVRTSVYSGVRPDLRAAAQERVFRGSP